MQCAKFNAIVVDPDHKTRMQLRHAISSVERFDKVCQLGLLSEAINKIETEGLCDVVFISYQYDTEEASRFISRAKTNIRGRDSAYVLICREEDQKSSFISSRVLQGIDAFLFEPYSVDSLVEIVLLAEKVKKERAMAREVATIEFLMTEVMNQIDLIAYASARGRQTERYRAEMTKSSEVIKALKGDSRDRYYSVAAEMFIKAPNPKRIYQRRKYIGASKRVQRSLEAKEKDNQS